MIQKKKNYFFKFIKRNELYFKLEFYFLNSKINNLMFFCNFF